MRRKGTNEQLAERRARGLALRAEGKTPKDVAEILEVTRRSVNRWEQESKHLKKKKATRARIARGSCQRNKGTTGESVGRRSVCLWVCRRLLDTGSNF
jgi:transcriptional regulator with XRE-family HTH domain